jgi:hypothetical protein
MSRGKCLSLEETRESGVLKRRARSRLPRRWHSALLPHSVIPAKAGTQSHLNALDGCRIPRDSGEYSG